MKNWLKNGSRWAANNRKKAIAAIVFIQIVCGTAAAFVGIGLFSEGKILPEWTVMAALLALGLAFFSFPKKRFTLESRRERARRWSLERMHHGLVFGLTMLGLVAFGNRLYVNSFSEKGLPTATAFSIVGSTEGAEKVAFEAEKAAKRPFFARKLTTPSKKLSQKILSKMQSAVSEGRSARGYFTAFLITLLGGFLMMVLGCNLACSSESSFGGVLLLVGILSIIASFVLLILGIVAMAGPGRPSDQPRPTREPRPKGWNLPDAVKD